MFYSYWEYSGENLIYFFNSLLLREKESWFYSLNLYLHNIITYASLTEHNKLYSTDTMPQFHF